MSLLDEAYSRTTAKLSEGGAAPPISRHQHVLFVPAGTASPGVFLSPEGEEAGFWLTLKSLAQGQEMAIINAGMPSGRSKKTNANFAQKLVQETMYLFHEKKPVVLGGEDAGVELHRSKREWLWNVLDQRGRNLVSQGYDALTEPVSTDDEGNG